MLPRDGSAIQLTSIPILLFLPVLGRRRCVQLEPVCMLSIA